MNFINGGGKSKNMGIVGTILAGWGCNVKYLLDNDKDKGGDKNLLKTWHLVDNVVYVQDKTGATADILSTADFKKYVLNNSNLKHKVGNSEYLKTKKKEKDKVLLARQFLQLI